MLRFHAQTGGSTLTAQQPENNIVRVALQAFSAVCGGGQSLHTNGFDEALALPTERSATIALRTQQILATEAGCTATADPFGGSYYIEALTAELEQQATTLIAQIDELGGAVAAVERGWVQDQIESAAFAFHERVQAGDEVLVGVNRWTADEEDPIELHALDPASERRQCDAHRRPAGPPRRRRGRGGAGSGGRDGGRRRQPVAADARRSRGVRDGRRGVRRIANALGHVRRAPRAPVIWRHAPTLHRGGGGADRGHRRGLVVRAG